MKVVSRLSQNMRNSFEVVQCTLLDKLIILSRTVFPKCWTSRNNGVNVILKYGKGGGRGSRTRLLQLKFYFDAGLFVIYIYVSFFLILFTLLFVSFFFSTEGNNLSVDGISYYLFVCVLAFVCST